MKLLHSKYLKPAHDDILRTVVLALVMATPPKKTATLIADMYLEKRSYSLEIWKASSRVWHRISTDTCPSIGSSCCRVASTNTAVLPIPDLAWQMTSIPEHETASPFQHRHTKITPKQAANGIGRRHI